MPEQYDDDRPTHRWVRVGYAKTPGGQIDRERLRNQPEHLPAEEAKRIVRNGYGQYLTDDEAAAMRAERAEVAEAVKAEPGARDGSADAPKVDKPAESTAPPITPPDVPAPSGKPAKPADIRKQGWGATDNATKEG